MASGTLGAEEPRERHRWNESSKVYTRKIHNKANKIKNINNNGNATNNQNTAATATTDNAAATTATNNNSENDIAQKDESTQNDKGNAVATTNDSNNAAPSPVLQSRTAEDANSHQQQPNSSRIDVFSGNSSSLNRQEGALPNGHEGNVGNGSAPVKPVAMRIGNKVSISLSAAKSKQERRELKRKLMSELEEIKSLAKKLEDKVAQLSGYNCHLATDGGVLKGVGGQSHSQYSSNDGLGKDIGVRVNSEAVSVGSIHSRPFQQLSISVMDNRHGVMEILEKEKRTPKANQYYRNSDFIYGTGKFPPAESDNKYKANASKKQGGGSAIDKQIFKKCGSLLTKLMKHQYGWVFNTPVDVKRMGLHDYYDIIKHPMDLGMVKNRLSKNWYKSPLQFAGDVRLTFCNARTYNPEGQDVHIMAVELSNIFEERWVEIEAEYNGKLRLEATHDMGFLTPTSRRAPVPTYLSPPSPFIPAPSVPPPPLYQETRHLDRSESFSLPVESRLKPVPPPIGRTPALKKPKANDPHKRGMTSEEKQKLSSNLQALPSEKLDSIVQIIKKRNSALCQHDDEIEVDIDSVDAETLWELDRFVTNYKKSLSKYKRKAELARQRAEAQQAMQVTVHVQNAVSRRPDVPNETRAEDTNAIAASSPVHERKHTDDASGSSSSTSSSSDSGSSSSDSDSDG